MPRLLVGNLVLFGTTLLWLRAWWRNGDRDKRYAYAALPFVVLDYLTAFLLERGASVDPDAVWFAATGDAATIGSQTFATAGIGGPAPSDDCCCAPRECPLMEAVATRLLVPVLVCVPLWWCYWRRVSRRSTSWWWLWALIGATAAVFFVMRDQCVQRVTNEWGADVVHWTRYGAVYLRRDDAAAAAAVFFDNGAAVAAATPGVAAWSSSTSAFVVAGERQTLPLSGAFGGPAPRAGNSDAAFVVDANGGGDIGAPPETRGLAFATVRLAQSGPLALGVLAYALLLLRSFSTCGGDDDGGGGVVRWARGQLFGAWSVPRVVAAILVLETLWLAHDFGHLVRVLQLNLLLALAYLALLRPRIDAIAGGGGADTDLTEYAAVLRARRTPT